MLGKCSSTCIYQINVSRATRLSYIFPFLCLLMPLICKKGATFTFSYLKYAINIHCTNNLSTNWHVLNLLKNYVLNKYEMTLFTSSSSTTSTTSRSSSITSKTVINFNTPIKKFNSLLAGTHECNATFSQQKNPELKEQGKNVFRVNCPDRRNFNMQVDYSVVCTSQENKKKFYVHMQST